MGARAPGWYNLDPTGNMKNNDDEFYCKDGWTYVMMREPKDAKLRGSVRFSLSVISLSPYVYPVFQFSSEEELMNIKRGFSPLAMVLWDWKLLKGMCK